MKIQSDPAAVINPATIGGPAATSRRPDTASREIHPSDRSGDTAATVQLSPRSRELHEAMTAAKAAPDVRHDLVEEIRQRLDAGTYRVDAGAIAQSILDRRA